MQKSHRTSHFVLENLIFAVIAGRNLQDYELFCLIFHEIGPYLLVLSSSDQLAGQMSGLV